MAKRRHTAEQIIAKPREAEVEQANAQANDRAVGGAFARDEASLQPQVRPEEERADLDRRLGSGDESG